MNTQPVLMNDFVRQWQDTGNDVLERVRQVGESGWYITGKQLAHFEGRLAAQVQRDFAIGCANGLDAIEIGLRALGIRPNDKVLTTPLSAFATSLAIVRAGGLPVFVDVDDSGLLDLERCAETLERDRSIRFMVPVHLYGQALDLEALGALKTKFDLKIVEDCAQAILAHWGAVPIASVGQISALSFYPTKNLGALGDAGALLTDHADLRQACISLRDYGQSGKYVHDVLGLNSRLDELHAAILDGAFLPRLEGWTKRRREIAQIYLADIEHPLVLPLPRRAQSRSVWHLFPVCVPAVRRSAFCKYLSDNGVHSGIHYPLLIPEQKALEAAQFEVYGSLSHARRIATEEVSLPIHPYLRDDEVKRVVELINRWPTS